MILNSADATPQHIIQHWIEAMTRSINERDLDVHMRLVSPKVQVYGMPSKAVINYNEWRERRQGDFSGGELLSIRYDIQRIITMMPRRLCFAARENLLNTTGKLIMLDKSIILEKEADNIWRVVEESIKDWKIKQYAVV